MRNTIVNEVVQPNDAYKKLAEMELKGKLDGIVTQNIDGLHQKAGSNAMKGIETKWKK